MVQSEEKSLKSTNQYLVTLIGEMTFNVHTWALNFALRNLLIGIYINAINSSEHYDFLSGLINWLGVALIVTTAR